jgi:hypothetical protein
MRTSIGGVPSISVLLVVLAPVFLGACGGEDRPTSVPTPRPGVSALSYSPQPFYNDRLVMHVTFTTTGPAGPGREYLAWLFTGGKSCHLEAASDETGPPIHGAAGETYTVYLSPNNFFDDARFCAGPAVLKVWSEREDFSARDGPRRRVFRELTFQIFEAR